MPIGEPRREVVEAVGHVLQAREEDERRPLAAPVEHLEPHAGRHRDEPHLVR